MAEKKKKEIKRKVKFVEFDGCTDVQIRTHNVLLTLDNVSYPYPSDIDRISEACRLKPFECFLYNKICHSARTQDPKDPKFLTAWHGIDSLARKMCVDRRTVIRAMKGLEFCGLIEVSRELGKSNNYRLIWPPEKISISNPPYFHKKGGVRKTPVSESHRGVSESHGGVSESHGSPVSESHSNNKGRNNKRIEKEYVNYAPGALSFFGFENFFIAKDTDKKPYQQKFDAMMNANDNGMKISDFRESKFDRDSAIRDYEKKQKYIGTYQVMGMLCEHEALAPIGNLHADYDGHKLCVEFTGKDSAYQHCVYFGFKNREWLNGEPVSTWTISKHYEKANVPKPEWFGKKEEIVLDHILNEYKMNLENDHKIEKPKYHIDCLRRSFYQGDWMPLVWAYKSNLRREKKE